MPMDLAALLETSQQMPGPTGVIPPPADAEGAMSMMAGESTEEGQQPKPERPKASKELEGWTKRWNETIKGGADTEDAIRQYREDLAALFPQDRRNRVDAHQGAGSKNILKERTEGGQANREDNRNITINHVYRIAQQTVATVCPGDITFRWKARKGIPAMGRMKPDTERDEFLTQFAITLTDRVERNLDEVSFIETLRSWFRHAVWFRIGILKVTYQRDFFGDSLSEERLPDKQEAIAKLRALSLRYSMGDFTKTDAEYVEMQGLGAVVGDDMVIDIWQGISAEVIPLNRWRYDRRIKQFDNIAGGDFQGDWVPMSGERILERFPYKPDSVTDGYGGQTWSGVHPDDLRDATECDEDLRLMTREEQNRQKPAAGGINGGAESSGTDEESRKRIYPVFECYCRISNKRYHFIPGCCYPIEVQRITRAASQVCPYYLINFNPQPGNLYGRSDTELQSSIQDRLNRKASDQEIARWLSMGPRGFADSNQEGAGEVAKLGQLPPGFIKLLNLAGMPLEKVVQWMQVPYFPESFDATTDMLDLQRMSRLPQQALGVTGQADFAAEIDAASAGSQQASADKQFDGNQSLKKALNGVAEMILQEESRELVLKESGPNALWPTIYSAKEAMRLGREVDEEVGQQQMQQIQAMFTESMMQGLPPPDVDPMQVEQDTAKAREDLCLKRFGYPEPASREALFRSCQLVVTADLNGVIDRERRVSQIIKLITAMTDMGVKLNLEPFSRILGRLMGEDDELGSIIQPNANMLAEVLSQSMQADPSSITPESAQIIVQLGMQLQQMMAQQQSAGGTLPPEGQSST